jgi:hypothetical protein
MLERRSFARWGHRSAVACAAGAIAYGIASIAVAVAAPGSIGWEGYERFSAQYSAWPTLAVILPPFVVSIAFPPLVAALYAVAPADRRPLAVVALVFAGVYTAVLGSAYWLQLTSVPWNIVRGAADGIEPWVIWNPASFFWSLETFAYFAMGLAMVFAAQAFDERALPRGIRRGMLGMGYLGVYFLSTSAKDVLLDPDPGAAWATVWSISAALAWVALFGYVSLGLARWFRGLASTGRSGDATATQGEESRWHPI